MQTFYLSINMKNNKVIFNSAIGAVLFQMVILCGVGCDTGAKSKTPDADQYYTVTKADLAKIDWAELQKKFNLEPLPGMPVEKKNAFPTTKEEVKTKKE